MNDFHPGDPRTLRLEIQIHNPRLVLCRAIIDANPHDEPNNPLALKQATYFGGHTSPEGRIIYKDFIAPSDYEFSGIAYGRLR